jgi:GT2 family glycosyltransferase
MVKVSAYVPVRNDLQYLSQCLTSLFAQSYPFHEVFVIDDASSDGLRSWAQEQREFPIKYIRINEHKGLAAARNEALRQCSCDFIAAVDADCTLNGDWLAVLVRYIEDKDLAGVGGQLIESASKSIPDQWRREYLYQTCGTTKKQMDFLPGCNTLFRKQALLSVGGYDERYYFQHEDTELGGRLKAAGWTMLYVPDAITFHNRKDSVSSVLRRCWGYRHALPISSMSELVIDVIREFGKGIKNFMTDLMRGRFHFCCTVDAVYFIYQALYSCKAYIRKDNNF